MNIFSAILLLIAELVSLALIAWFLVAYSMGDYWAAAVAAGLESAICGVTVLGIREGKR